MTIYIMTIISTHLGNTINSVESSKLDRVNNLKIFT